MISTTSSANSGGYKTVSDARRFRDVFVYTLRKNYGIGLILLGLLLLFQVVPYYTLSSLTMPVTKPEGVFDLTMFLTGSQNLWVTPLVGLVVLVLIVRVFGYMQKNGQVDLWHALPVRRSTLFLAKYSGIAVLVLIPLILLGLWTTGVLASVSHGMDFSRLAIGTSFSPVVIYLQSFARDLLTLFSCAGMLLAIYVVLGSSFDAIGAFAIINFLWPALVALLYGRYCASVPGIEVNFSQPAVLNVISIFSPIVGHFSRGLLNWTFSEMQSTSSLGFFEFWYWLLFGAVCTISAFVFYLRRPSEKAGALSANHSFFKVIRVLAALTVGFGLSAVFTPTSRNLVVDVLCLVAGSLLTHVVMELIAARGASTLLKSGIQYAVALLLIIGLALGISFDVLGITRYRPQAEQLDGVVFELNSGHYGGAIYLSKEDYPEEVATILKIHEVGNGKERFFKPYGKQEAAYLAFLEEPEAETDQIVSDLKAYYFEAATNERVRIAFVEKSGRRVYRTYDIDFDEAKELTQELFNSPVLGSYINPVLMVRGDDIPTPELYVANTDMYVDYSFEDDEKSSLKISVTEQQLDQIMGMIRQELLPEATVLRSGYKYRDAGMYDEYAEEGDYELVVDLYYPRNRYPGLALTKERREELGFNDLPQAGFNDFYSDQERNTYYMKESMVIRRSLLPEVCDYIDTLLP